MLYIPTSKTTRISHYTTPPAPSLERATHHPRTLKTATTALRPCRTSWTYASVRKQRTSRAASRTGQLIAVSPQPRFRDPKMVERRPNESGHAKHQSLPRVLNPLSLPPHPPTVDKQKQKPAGKRRGAKRPPEKRRYSTHLLEAQRHRSAPLAGIYLLVRTGLIQLFGAGSREGGMPLLVGPP